MIKALREEIDKCQVCVGFLPYMPNPIYQFSKKSKVLIIAQAPGQIAHDKGIPFDDKSGDTLRSWLGVTKDEFYNPDLFAIVPMGLCFPGKGKSGDLPPRKECAPKWHNDIFNELKEVQLIVLIGKYSQDYYLTSSAHKSLTQKVQNFHEFFPRYFPIVHPSPLNFRWHGKNKWFMVDVIPVLQTKIAEILKS